MKWWWLHQSGRVRIEKVAIERIVANENWFTLTQWKINQFRLSVEGVITAHGIGYPIRLIYPDQFPSVPAWVEPQDGEVRWSNHQYGKGGSLCLELRPDNWVPEATGADVLRSAFHLLKQENPLGDGEKKTVQSAHNIGDIQSYDWGLCPVLIGQGCLERLRSGNSEGLLALRWHVEDKVWPIMVFDGVDRAQIQHPPSFDLGTLRFEVPVAAVRAETPHPLPSDRAGLVDAMPIELSQGHEDSGLVILVIDSNNEVTPIHSPDAASVYPRQLFVLRDQFGLRSGRQESAMGKSVAIVGLGSVGSKIAEILLRSGIHHFVLVDGDVFLPPNLERHILDWRDVGFRKVNAVRRKLLHIVPGANVDVVANNLNWQRSARTHANEIAKIGACDLVIDATGDTPSALLIGAIAAENKKPFISAQTFEGGLGCLLLRAIPDRDPPFVVGRMQYEAYCEAQNVAPPSSGKNDYEALSDDGQPLIADDAAASLTASHAARIVLDILDGKLDPEDAACLLLGFRRGWLFKRHGHTIDLELRIPPATTTIESDDETGKFVAALVAEALDEAENNR